MEITSAEAAKRLGLTEFTVQQYLRDGLLEGRIDPDRGSGPGRWVVAEEEVTRFKDRLPRLRRRSGRAVNWSPLQGEWASTKQVARIADVETVTVTKWIRKGWIRGRKIFGAWLIHVPSLEGWRVPQSGRKLAQGSKNR